ncbi:Acyl-coenzyme A:6-aminopenicillanic acid acyl-transferase [Pseudomonas amygdali pv. dendropanacis]|uniref:Acyl-coenzyme A:6-aminopenicillanic acid acyl-transferase n=1 Tax=Pseudomonas amygdali pv. dendropanacis TaxID=235272 RepID=A0A0P9Q3J9_PSEA0|nr:acyl-CoA--6-aminopenicillanic acid acyl-transferase [Pseudomonas amygdali]KPX25318.1 Acyl-coenzyme A:6-aminopenicillanic acid acyl-transferase [Pseudomonas amygdali pv. dendropanacis]KWS82163.1 acyl-CoA--6-aminopenicillanic acid acyl-transferase [Pseudomonas amygdali pv. dendropanacis]
MLAQLHIVGSAFELGRRLGEFGRQSVQGKLRTLPFWQRLASLADTDKARQMKTLVQEWFPRYWQEIEGLAVGLELPVDEVFMWNCRGDFPGLGSVDGCTTVFGQTEHGTLIAHNEDGLPQLREDCGIVHVRPDEGAAFISFVYPGSLPGHTFAVNEFGVVATVNNIRPTDIPVGLPRMILGRASLDARTVNEAIAAVSLIPRAGAFHHVFGQAGSSRIVSVEATSDAVAVREVEVPTGHSNHLVDRSFRDFKQIVTGSSGTRQCRVDQLLADSDRQLDLTRSLQILRDEVSTTLPVYRCAEDDPDDENTLATATFTLTSSSVEWRVYARRATEHPDAQGAVELAQ